MRRVVMLGNLAPLRRPDGTKRERRTMTRAPFQVLVLPYRIRSDEEIVYAVFRRRDAGAYWQGIAGGGELGETPLEAAKREAWEEAGIDPGSAYVELESLATIPAIHFAPFRDRTDLFVVPEHSFGVEVVESALRLSDEHAGYAWLPYEDAHRTLRWDSNKNALWELDRRLKLGVIPRRGSGSGT
jgi:dATP pyrophosphohydrolase